MNMNKKFLATFICGAVALTAVAGLTACGGNGGAVSADEWAEAFENTINAENYTASFNMEVTSNSVAVQDGNKVSYNLSLVTAGTFYFDANGKQSLNEMTITNTTSGEGIPEEMLGEEVTLDKTFNKIEGKTLWGCVYDEVNDEWDADFQEFETEAKAKEFFAITDFSQSLSAKQYFTALPAAGEAKSLSELYSSFTYANGKYTATVYVAILGGTYGEASVTICIDNGYVTGLSVESGSESTQNGTTVKAASKASYVLSNIGSTQVTAPEDALKAIEAAKTAA